MLVVIATERERILLALVSREEKKKAPHPHLKADGSLIASGFGHMIHFNIIELGEGAFINYS